MARRTPLRRSWLELVRDASSAVVGTARDVADLGAKDTSPRTAAYAVEADLDVDEALFGTAPSSTRLSGTSSLPPDQRGPESFPPDLLRETPFWDEAAPGASTRVLALLGDGEPVVRSLHEDDPLPGDVRTIREWVEESGSLSDVVIDLGRRAAGPVAFSAGLTLLVSEGDDPAVTFTALRKVPRRVEGALAGAIERLRIEAAGWEDDDVADLAEALAAGWEDERDPATVVAYLTWFDANHGSVPELRETIARLAERDASARFDGQAWDDEVHRRAEALRAEL